MTELQKIQQQLVTAETAIAMARIRYTTACVTIEQEKVVVEKLREKLRKPTLDIHKP